MVRDGEAEAEAVVEAEAEAKWKRLQSVLSAASIHVGRIASSNETTPIWWKQKWRKQ